MICRHHHLGTANRASCYEYQQEEDQLLGDKVINFVKRWMTGMNSLRTLALFERDFLMVANNLPVNEELMNDNDRDVLTATINAIRAIDSSAAGDVKPPPNITN